VKSLSEQDHYEILETAPDAGPEEIERSYRMALATFADDSLAGYSVFSDGDNEAMRERIEIAFRVLSDINLRRDYDAMLGVPVPAPVPPSARPAKPMVPTGPKEPLRPSVDLAAEARQPDLADFERLDSGDGDFDGGRLRSYRMRCGFELEDVAGVTKINPSYLRFIEEERWIDLPDAVYVRGFVSAYAQCLGLDSQRVAKSYMARFEHGREEPRKGRFFDSR
jgi:curved DNA-binding protein CbpA